VYGLLADHAVDPGLADDEAERLAFAQLGFVDRGKCVGDIGVLGIDEGRAVKLAAGSPPAASRSAGRGGTPGGSGGAAEGGAGSAAATVAEAGVVSRCWLPQADDRKTASTLRLLQASLRIVMRVAPPPARLFSAGVRRGNQG
jgi:hypothetical protein